MNRVSKDCPVLSGSSELSSIAPKWLQMSLRKLSCFSLETSNLLGVFLSYGRRTGWTVRLSLLTTGLRGLSVNF